MPYEVKLEAFEGPLDLLLHLITRRRVDIYDIPLASITEEYLAAVKSMATIDLETATGFLVVAATLLELKSARLLPAPHDEESDRRLLEERDLLLARLVECSTFREAGTWISTRLAAGEAFHGRSVGLEAPYADLAPDLLARTKPERLAAAAARMLAPKVERELDTSHVAPIKASVRDAILELADRLKSSSKVSFEELCGRSLPRIEVIVRFLALLELFKAGAVDLEQADRFGDIRAVWVGAEDAENLLDDVDEYALGHGEG